MTGAKRLAYGAAVGTGADRLSRYWHRHELLILVYHGLHEGRDPGDVWHLLPVTRFEQQLRYLSRHYRIIHLDDALSRLGREGLAGPTAAITFDDGYHNNATLGFPVLERLGVPATIYLATGLIGTDRRLWTFDVEAGFENATVARVDLSELGLGVVSLDGRVGRRRMARQAIERLKRLGPADRGSAVARLENRLCPRAAPVDPRTRMMSWDDVARLDASGLVRFGAHTVDHEIVSRLSDRELEEQVGDSLAAVREAVTTPARSFAYPNGEADDFDGRVADVLHGHGIPFALSTLEGLNGPATPPYALRRVTIANDTTMTDFKLRTSGLIAALKGGGRG